MDQIQALPWTLLAITMVFTPGWSVLAAWRVGPLVALACAPALTVFGVAVGAVAANVLGFAWTWPWLLIPTVAVSLAGWWNRAHRPSAAPDTRAELGPLGQYGIGMVVGWVLVNRHLMDALISPDHFSQRFDNAFHLNAIRWVVDTGLASPFEFGPIGGPPFYPAAWHDLVGLFVANTGVPIVAAVQICTLVMVWLAWPLALAFLAETIWPMNPVARLMLGTLSLAFTSFPIGLLDWGTLYPNLLGLVLAPAGIAAGWIGFKMSDRPALAVGRARILAAVILVAIGLAHPNALLASVLVLVPVAAAGLVRGLKVRGADGLDRAELVWQRLVGVALVCFPVLWFLAGHSLPDTPSKPFDPLPSSVLKLLLGASVDKTVVWPFAIGLWLGLVACLVQRATRLLVVCFAVICLPYLATSALSNRTLVNLLSGPFYNDPYRTASVIAPLAVVLAVGGWGWFTTTVVDLVARRWSAQPSGRVALAAGLTAALLIGWLTGTGRGMHDAYESVASAFAMDDESDILNPDEYELLKQLPELVPPDAVIVTNPWQGAGLTYAIADRHVTQYYMFGEVPDDVSVINRRLNQANTSPSVCRALERTGAEYVLVFDSRFISSAVEQARRINYAGLTSLGRTPGFQLVASHGDAALYRITACR